MGALVTSSMLVHLIQQITVFCAGNVGVLMGWFCGCCYFWKWRMVCLKAYWCHSSPKTRLGLRQPLRQPGNKVDDSSKVRQPAQMGCTPQKGKMEPKNQWWKFIFMFHVCFQCFSSFFCIASTDQPYSASLGTCNRWIKQMLMILNMFNSFRFTIHFHINSNTVFKFELLRKALMGLLGLDEVWLCFEYHQWLRCRVARVHHVAIGSLQFSGQIHGVYGPMERLRPQRGVNQVRGGECQDPGMNL